MALIPLVVALTGVPMAPPPAVLPVELAVLAEINRARLDPASYVDSLRTWRGYYHGRLVVPPGSPVDFVTEEGVAPVDEAIGYLAARDAAAPLVPAGTLAAAAADHGAEQRADGAVGHGGRDGSGPADRVQRHGGGSYVGEVIAYGSETPADIVRQLVVDDGVGDRGHRKLLFDNSLRYAGVACGAHPVYRYMCVITLARTPDGRPVDHG